MINSFEMGDYSGLRGRPSIITGVLKGERGRRGGGGSEREV